MRVPAVLTSLSDQGIIDQVMRPLKSGKEAQVYLVEAGGEVRVAKVYKDAEQRSFKQRALYTEGRRVRNTRDQRAIAGRTRHGKAQEEGAWKTAEMDVIYRLHAQGVRVPTPHNFIDGVLIMELVMGHDGQPAPRLSEMDLSVEMARTIYDQLLREVIKMLCAGIVHGDLSDYNVLVDTEGPVIIDFPQSVDASKNRNARKLLVRDVDNLGAFLTRCIPSARRRPYGQEIWDAYENNRLTPDLELTGQTRHSSSVTNVGAILEEIEDAERYEQKRREAAGEAAPRPRRREVIIAPAPTKESRPAGGRRRRGGGGKTGRDGAAEGQPRRRSRGRGGRDGSNGRGVSPQDSATGQTASNGRGRRDEQSPRANDRRRDGAAHGANDEAARASDGTGAPKRRRRRRRGGAGKGSGGGGGQPDTRRDAGSPQQSERKAPAKASSTGESTSDAPRSRRRRRRGRRRGPGAPADGSADRQKPTGTGGAES